MAIRFQIRPASNSDAYFAPYIGYRNHSFGIAPAFDGTTLDGPAGTKSTLPPITYSALKIGIAGELPFGNSGLLAYGRFAVLPVLSAGQIVSAAYFPNGSALGIDLGLGLGFKMPFAKVLQVRLGFEFARYGLSFKSVPADPYYADGAVDQYLGGTLAVRFTY